jgi:peptidoglycan/LPS O-acetylase OafA/YrhL
MGQAAAIDDRHLIRIDVLRGVAILLVLVFHSYGAAFGRDHIDFGKLIDGSLPHPGWPFLLLYLLRFGSVGVSLFFVISGYVIHRSYLRDSRFSWSSYASRRFWRIYPAYFLALLGFAVWMNVVDTADFALHAGLGHNISANTYFSINPSFWSLAVEVQLYALYPLAIFARRSWGAGGMLAVGLLASSVWRAAAFAHTEWQGLTTFHIWTSPIALWPDWLLGAYLAEQHASGRRVFRRPHLWACCGTVLYVLGEFVVPLRTMQFSLASLVAAVGLEAYLHREASPGRLARYLAVVGICSYSLYLIHQPLMSNYASLLSWLGMSHPVAQVVFGFPVYVGVAILVAWAMYSTVERGGVRLSKWLSTATRRDKHPKVQAADHTQGELGRGCRGPDQCLITPVGGPRATGP